MKRKLYHGGRHKLLSIENTDYNPVRLDLFGKQ